MKYLCAYKRKERLALIVIFKSFFKQLETTDTHKNLQGKDLDLDLNIS